MAIAFSWHRIYIGNIYNNENYKRSEFNIQDEPVGKYTKSKLNPDILIKLGEELDKLLESEEVITNSDLSLKDLAKLLEVNPHAVSQVLNFYYNKGFYQLLRDVRVKKAKELLQNTNLPVTRICFDAGFNSKNTFLRAFRESTGLTPTEYKLRSSKKNPI